MRLRVERNAVVHRRIVEAGFERRADQRVDAVALLDVADYGFEGRGTPGEKPAALASLPPPVVPAEQIRIDALQEPALPPPPVDLAANPCPDGRFGAVPAHPAGGLRHVRHQSGLGDLVGDRHRIGHRQFAGFEAEHEGGEVGIPLEQHPAAPSDAPGARHRRDDAVFHRVENRIPRQNRPVRLVDFGQRPVGFGPRGERGLKSGQFGGNLLDGARPPRAQSDWTIGRQRQIRGGRPDPRFRHGRAGRIDVNR